MTSSRLLEDDDDDDADDEEVDDEDDDGGLLSGLRNTTIGRLNPFASEREGPRRSSIVNPIDCVRILSKSSGRSCKVGKTWKWIREWGAKLRD